LAVGLPLLQACGDDNKSGGKNTSAIKDGLKPEAGPLKIFNYDSYVSPDVVAAFEAKYGVKVDITTFTTDDEAITKLASGAVDVDLHHSASTTTLFKLVDTGLIQPLNKTYLTNIGNVAASLRDPYYDKGAVYTVPYTVFSTGIGFRADKVDTGSVSWDTLWNPDYKGVTSLLDDVREGLPYDVVAVVDLLHRQLVGGHRDAGLLIDRAGQQRGAHEIGDRGSSRGTPRRHAEDGVRPGHQNNEHLLRAHGVVPAVEATIT